MTVWIIVDDCPPEFGQKDIIQVCSSKNLAEAICNGLKAKEPYLYQYLEVKRFRVKSSL